MSIFTALHAGAIVAVAATLNLTPASAGSISTPILFLGSSTQTVCIANNVTGASVTVGVRIIGIVSGGASDTCTLPANDRGGCEVFFNGAGQCRITMPNLTNDQVRQRVRGVMFLRRTTAPFAIETAVQAE
jgi:hypothetical protein